MFAIAEADFKADFPNRRAEQSVSVECGLFGDFKRRQKGFQQSCFGFADDAAFPSAEKWGLFSKNMILIAPLSLIFPGESSVAARLPAEMAVSSRRQVYRLAQPEVINDSLRR